MIQEDKYRNLQYSGDTTKHLNYGFISTYFLTSASLDSQGMT